MAHPRIFVSSTYYDLKNVRADLERYIRARGFDSVLNERGQIPYGSDQNLEEYCYKEIENCDILVSIIGGQFGSDSSHDPYSISQKELKTAIELGRPVYMFIEQSVLAEYKIYERNKGNDKIKYAAVDDVKIFKFLDEIFSLALNNQVTPFETSSDITSYLQEQWSGLFHRLLQNDIRHKEVMQIKELQETAQTLGQLVTFLTENRRTGDEVIKDILLTNHPIFEAIRQNINAPYRVFFTNKEELSALLKARQYKLVESDAWDQETRDSHEEWLNSRMKPSQVLKVAFDVFDENGKLKIFTPDEWEREWVISCEYIDEDDDIPF